MVHRIELAHTQGFCAGVAMAIDVVEAAIERYGVPLYVRHHIVHNTRVIDDFQKRGVVFVESLLEVPVGERVILSAHGSAPDIYTQAKTRQLTTIDATCPLVTKVHRNAMRFSSRHVQTVLIGHRGHQELIGTSGYVDETLLHIVETVADIDALVLDSARPIGFLTQTTLSVCDTMVMIAALKKKYPHVIGAKKADICFATQNRQDAVVELSQRCDGIIICGSPHSSNSNRLKEVAQQQGVPSVIIDTVAEFDWAWLDKKQRLGISSGASVPQATVDELVTALCLRYPGVAVLKKESVEEGISFKRPAMS